MSDLEETDVFWESLTSPGKRKKDKKSSKHKNNIKMKTDEKIRRKKKKTNLEFKDAMVGRKAKRKEKKKKKNRLALDLGDTFILTQASNAQAKPAVRPKISSPRHSDQLKADHLDQESKKKTKRKKKVAFDLSPGYIRVKRPKFLSSFSQCPKESVLSENEVLRDSESCSQAPVSGHSRGPTHEDDSQCNSEEINSQDLFITQKTFRVSPSEPSSGEASDKAVPATPQMFTQRDQLHTSVSQIKLHFEEDSHLQKHLRKTNGPEMKPKTVQVLLTEEEEEEGVNKAHHKHKKGKLSFQTQTELKANFTEEKKALNPVRMKPRAVNPYLAEPCDINTTLDAVRSKEHSCTLSQQSTTSTSTQTENLFTTELSSYLNFCRKSILASLFEDLKPLDLSLPERARKDLGMCLSVKTSSLAGKIQGDSHKDANPHPSCPSGMKDTNVKREPSGQAHCSMSAQGKGETTPSSQSESEPKSADTTTSSEDSETACRTGKLDLTQVRPHDTLPTVDCSSYTDSAASKYILSLYYAQAAIFTPVLSLSFNQTLYQMFFKEAEIYLNSIHLQIPVFF